MLYVDIPRVMKDIRDHNTYMSRTKLITLAILIVLTAGTIAYFLTQRTVLPASHVKAPVTNTPPDAHADLIRVDSPKSGEIVTSPLQVSGTARGTWYFEASFPVKLFDANGDLIVSTPASAKGDWMTTEFVPFTATLTFSQPKTATGTLVLEKDNPSGLPQYEDRISIPVRFVTAAR